MLFGIWYTDEEVCRKQGLGKILWIKNQRKLQKGEKTQKRGYFTKEMLDRNIRLSKTTAGINPDSINTAELEKNWIESRKPIRELSEEEKNVLRDRIKKASLQGVK
jgi:hypothetical protein